MLGLLMREGELTVNVLVQGLHVTDRQHGDWLGTRAHPDWLSVHVRLIDPVGHNPSMIISLHIQ